MRKNNFNNTMDQNLSIVITVIVINMVLTSTLKFFIGRGFQLPIITIDRIKTVSEFMKLVTVLLPFRRVRLTLWNLYQFIKNKLTKKDKVINKNVEEEKVEEDKKNKTNNLKSPRTEKLGPSEIGVRID